MEHPMAHGVQLFCPGERCNLAVLIAVHVVPEAIVAAGESRASRA